MAFPVLLDACVLVPVVQCDLLLRLAEAGLYEPRWSEDILTEDESTLIGTVGITAATATRRVRQMRVAFPHAAVDKYENLVMVMTNHPRTATSLAAAVQQWPGW